jgi:hypothetical protein
MRKRLLKANTFSQHFLLWIFDNDKFTEEFDKNS